jgi:hypothetical protein
MVPGLLSPGNRQTVFVDKISTQYVCTGRFRQRNEETVSKEYSLNKHKNASNRVESTTTPTQVLF